MDSLRRDDVHVAAGVGVAGPVSYTHLRNISRLHHITSLNFEQFAPILREQFFAEIVSGSPASREDISEQLDRLKIPSAAVDAP